jgi:hypothetical protein
VIQGFTAVVSPDACELCQQYGPDNKPTGHSLYPFTSIEDAQAQIGQYESRTLPPYHPNCRCITEPILVTYETPQYQSMEKLEQFGSRPAEKARPRPGGAPEKAKPLQQFVKQEVKAVEKE